MRGRFIFVAALLAIALLGFYLYKKYRVAPDLQFRNLPLSDLQGNETTLQSFAGKPLVLSFAASWCGPCINELSSLREASAAVLPFANVVVVSDESPENILRLKELGNFPFEFMQLDQQFSDVGIHSIPTTYIFNSQGKVVKEHVGFIDWNDPSSRQHLISLMSSDH